MADLKPYPLENDRRNSLENKRLSGDFASHPDKGFKTQEIKRSQEDRVPPNYPGVNNADSYGQMYPGYQFDQRNQGYGSYPMDYSSYQNMHPMYQNSMYQYSPIGGGNRFDSRSQAYSMPGESPYAASYAAYNSDMNSMYSSMSKYGYPMQSQNTSQYYGSQAQNMNNPAYRMDGQKPESMSQSYYPGGGYPMDMVSPQKAIGGMGMYPGYMNNLPNSHYPMPRMVPSATSRLSDPQNKIQNPTAN